MRFVGLKADKTKKKTVKNTAEPQRSDLKKHGNGGEAVADR